MVAMKLVPVLSRCVACALVSGLMVLAALCSASASTDPGYAIGPQDKLMIRVGQWVGATGEYKGWKDISGEYRVSAAGTVSLPIVGSIHAAGQTPDALAKVIATAMDSKVGLPDPVTASVDVLEYRPIYVTGSVNRPGAFPWVPGLTVMQAVGLAGGLEKSGSVFLNSDRNAINALGDYSVDRLRLWQALARRARLEAELAGSDTIKLPEELKNAPMANALLSTERDIMQARARSLKSSQSQIDSLEQLLTQEIGTLREQIKLRQHEVDLAKKDLAGVSSLRDKGLILQSRETDLERTVAELESQKLGLETTRLEAEQNLNKAQRDKADLLNEQRKGIVTDLADTRTKIAELHAQIETEQGLYAEASRFGTGEFRLSGSGGLEFVRQRTDADHGPSTEVVTQSARLNPGDVLEVKSPTLDNLPVAPRGAVSSSVVPSAGLAAFRDRGGGWQSGGQSAQAGAPGS